MQPSSSSKLFCRCSLITARDELARDYVIIVHVFTIDTTGRTENMFRRSGPKALGVSRIPISELINHHGNRIPSSHQIQRNRRMMGKGVSKTAEQYVRYEYVSFSAQNKSSTPVNKQHVQNRGIAKSFLASHYISQRPTNRFETHTSDR